ncbi:bifunctional phosphopantothenoylcysteine decarboxylase/phosphopantothenate--cysteine ligase CoaBC [Xylanibacillus composti]|nr:bifunctional phosphopantothenoylcysteine decarboxylase/phosphopantothenate--cysteine ligase CoaBC [Xylanibacillus composti]MDT9725593.1 bifunctional phosphopantothenoylcysteine decarboxylase/phosphopantothenate--cysteine ligase CoaBC [Xylanibacillus composti]
MLTGKTIVLGVAGGIACYKALTLASRLTQAGAKVRVMMTNGAAQFVTPLSFQTITRHPVATDTFDEKDPAVVQHIDLADSADLIVIAPATANILAKLAHGLADEIVSTTLLAATCPVMVAPAMNVHMYTHPAVQQNMNTLMRRGVLFIEPGTGALACGYTGKGRMAEPEQIVERIAEHFAQVDAHANDLHKPLAGKRILVTGGGTRERIDPVRYLGNDSSGKMGAAIAAAAQELGAQKVTFIAANATAATPPGVERIEVESAEQMLEAVMGRLSANDMVVKAAAVADYRPKHVFSRKIKKQEDSLMLELERTPDILHTIGHSGYSGFVIGFAAETGEAAEYAMDKLRRKNCDLIAANNVLLEGAGFGTDTNVLEIYGPEGLVAALPAMSKQEAAKRLLTLAAERMAAHAANQSTAAAEVQDE